MRAATEIVLIGASASYIYKNGVPLAGILLGALILIADLIGV